MKYEQLIKKLRAGDKFRNAIYPPTSKELQAVAAIEELLDCVSTKEYATIHDVSPERVKVLCREKRICGARKVGGSYIIPRNSPYPEDRRLSKNK